MSVKRSDARNEKPMKPSKTFFQYKVSRSVNPIHYFATNWNT